MNASNIRKAQPDDAEALFDIMVRATGTNCSASYPPEIMEIWHKGRTPDGMRKIIITDEFYCLTDDRKPLGFVHFTDTEIVGLCIDPEYHGIGVGTRLFEFAASRIPARPLRVNSSLNAEGFYQKRGCVRVGMGTIRRNDHDIYVVKMELQ